jgi:hypothetical protein
MRHKQAFCYVCEHEIVPGVACDGTLETCPSQTPHMKKQRLTSDFAATVDKVTGEKDFDCVKGLD